MALLNIQMAADTKGNSIRMRGTAMGFIMIASSITDNGKRVKKMASDL